MTPPRLPPALLALTPGRLSGDRASGAAAGRSGNRVGASSVEAERLLAAVRSAVAAGLAGVLVREPGLEDRALLELAWRVRAILDEARSVSAGGGDADPPGGEQAWLGIHDRPHLVRAARADGVHLGFRSLPPEAVRALVPPGCAIGISTHAGDPLGDLECDYAFHGPVRATPSKDGLKEPIGFDALAQAAAASRVPLWAIGGLEPTDVGRAVSAGARGVAVLRGVLGAADPARAATAYAAALVVARRESR